MRYMLIDGHGNFGSVDGDPPAAYRYTEARMSKLSVEMLKDIEKDTVDFSPNYDDRLKEPNVLPSHFPNILVNGSTGIAVGMATNIPPHNMGEVLDGVCAMVDNPDIDLDGLMQYIKGPDFPTGGIIMAAAAFAPRTAPAAAEFTCVPAQRSWKSRTAATRSSSPSAVSGQQSKTHRKHRRACQG